MPLTDTAIRSTKAASKPAKLFDEKGLFLLVTPTGGKWWRFKYRYQGKEKLLSLGTYPEVSLRQARDARDDARQQLRAGIDPGAARKAMKAAQAEDVSSFEVIAREWFARFEPTWAPGHSRTIMRRLERDAFPWIGKRPIAEITPPELLATIRRIESRGALETAHRVLQICGQVFRYAIVTGRATANPAGDLRGALPPAKEKHHATITDPKAIGELLRAIEGYQGTFTTLCALKLAPLVFLRPGELRQAEWAEFDLDKALWQIPAKRMKIKDQGDHIVPLSNQALAILRELQPLTGSGRYVFAGARSATRPMSENTVNAALRRLGYTSDQQTGHGFRATARTILDEELKFRPDYIEHQLAHAVRDPHGRAYNRTAHLAERRRMMQAWADYLDRLRDGADVIPLHGIGAA